MLAYRRSIAEHLSCLSKLLERRVIRDDLLGLDETERIRIESIAIALPSSSCDYPFSMLRSERFREFIALLDKRAEGKEVYLWLPTTNDCGLLPPVPLKTIQFGFEFSFSSCETLTVTTVDYKECMLLDWFEEGNEELVQVKVYGEAWKETLRWWAIDSKEAFT